MVVVSNDPFGVNVRKETVEDYSKPEKCAVSCEDTSTRLLPPNALPPKPIDAVLELLAEGVKEQNIITIKQCIYNLDQRLDQFNSLVIFCSLSKYSTPTNNNYEPSAPPMNGTSNWLQDLIQNLRHHCLMEIDKHADFVLKQADVLQLNYIDLLSIIERDSLQVANECVVYVTIYKWAVNECHRRGIDETDLHNIKKVLQRLQYSPRYGLMTKQKFTSKFVDGVPGPTRSGILDEKDWRLIKFYIEDKTKNRPVKDLPYRWSTPRCSSKDSPTKLNSTCSSPLGRKRTSCERCIINFLTCWTAVFD